MDSYFKTRPLSKKKYINRNKRKKVNRSKKTKRYR